MKHRVLITGSIGLIGYEATQFYLQKGYEVIGIDNDLRSKLFNIKTQYFEKLNILNTHYKNKYIHYETDIRNTEKIEHIFKSSQRVNLIIHTAAQTSHDWAQKDPITDYSINSYATLQLLEMYRKYCSHAVFIFTSTNKVYGDLVNLLHFKESAQRYDLSKSHLFYKGIPETFSIDQSTHSLFGVSKVSADLLVQEYGRYFGLNTGVFRLGVVSGGGQSGALYQGFLSYFLEKAKKKQFINIIGYKGKQLRDIIHASDVVSAFNEYYKNPKNGEVYNLGGGRSQNISLIELISLIQDITNYKIKTIYQPKPRIGDHKWWITDTTKFEKDYPKWKRTKNINEIIKDIWNSLV